MVRVRERTYELDGAESRSLATIGAFRVVRTEDLRDPSDPRDRRLKHLRDQGLVRSVSLGGRTRDVVVLTREGRDALEARRRDDAPEPRQALYDGLRKPRELTHDASLYRAYRRAAERLKDHGAELHPRIVITRSTGRDHRGRRWAAAYHRSFAPRGTGVRWRRNDCPCKSFETFCD